MDAKDPALAAAERAAWERGVADVMQAIAEARANHRLVGFPAYTPINPY